MSTQAGFSACSRYKAPQGDLPLLEQDAYKRFELRIYPIVAKGEQRIKATYFIRNTISTMMGRLMFIQRPQRFRRLPPSCIGELQ